jgi:hypothetical protein
VLLTQFLAAVKDCNNECNNDGNNEYNNGSRESVEVLGDIDEYHFAVRSHTLMHEIRGMDLTPASVPRTLLG